jgi:cob(I)alamin adenosyltransferase
MALSISTKTGDAGESGLASGQRFSKASQIFEVLGTVDELNSWLGYLVAKLQHKKLHKQLTTIQDTLFHLGAEVAGSKKTEITQKHLTVLETWAKSFEKELADHWHQNFLLPGGSELGGITDIARTVCRRCEREIVSYRAEHANSSPLVLKYINRLSDYLYLVRCWLNREAGVIEKKFQIETEYVKKVKPRFK